MDEVAELLNAAIDALEKANDSAQRESEDPDLQAEFGRLVQAAYTLRSHLEEGHYGP